MQCIGIIRGLDLGFVFSAFYESLHEVEEKDQVN